MLIMKQLLLCRQLPISNRNIVLSSPPFFLKSQFPNSKPSGLFEFWLSDIVWDWHFVLGIYPFVEAGNRFPPYETKKCVALQMAHYPATSLPI